MMQNRPTRWLLHAALIATLAGPACAPPAFAQDDSRETIAMQNQIAELRQDIDQLRAQLASGGGGRDGPPAQAPLPGTPASIDMLPQLLDRVSQLEEQVRTLQGQADETRHQLQQQNADLSKQIADLAFRVQTPEGNTAAAPGATPPATVPGPPPTHLLGANQPAAPPPLGGVQAGYAALARRDYPAAEAAARQALANPRSPRAYDAQFLLAQALAGQRQYQQAALAYDDSYGKSRRGAHAPDALLGLAASLVSLGEKPAACATLDKLHTEFPTRADLRAPSASIGRRANCR